MYFRCISVENTEDGIVMSGLCFLCVSSRTCNSDGVLLMPSRPAMMIDASILNVSNHDFC